MIDCLIELAGWLCRLADQPFTSSLPESLMTDLQGGDDYGLQVITNVCCPPNVNPS